MDESGAVVDFADVAVRRGISVVLRDVDLRIEPGEVIGLFGGNGAGKTTLLDVMATALRPSSGSAHVLGIDLLGDDRIDLRGRIG